MNSYIEKVLLEAEKRNKNEPEFLQSVKEVLRSIENVIEEHPEYEKTALLERLIEPERVISFRVSWTDDEGKTHVNRAYRVQFNGALGPYKGGLRFHPSVNLSILKFLGFEQIFKNSLTGLPIGGGKGGADFDPHGKSDSEIMRFCQAFMTELQRHIGSSLDVPAGDIGVGKREIGYLFGQYRRIRNAFDNGALTGKALSYGGSLIRPEATGYGVLYYADEALKRENDSLQGKKIAISGYGNVAWGLAKKAAQMGARVISLSGHNGYVHDEDGITSEEKLNFMLEMRSANNANVKLYADKFGCEFHEGKKPWELKADIYIPCATQNEIDLAEAEKIVSSGAKYYFEGANMPATGEAIAYLQKNRLIVGPAKAANAGGVAVSALEMAQNAQRYSWTEQELDEKLKAVMKSIYYESLKAAQKYGLGCDLVKGANIAGFIRVADAMQAQGII